MFFLKSLKSIYYGVFKNDNDSIVFVNYNSRKIEKTFIILSLIFYFFVISLFKFIPFFIFLFLTIPFGSFIFLKTMISINNAKMEDIYIKMREEELRTIIKININKIHQILKSLNYNDNDISKRIYMLNLKLLEKNNIFDLMYFNDSIIKIILELTQDSKYINNDSTKDSIIMKHLNVLGLQIMPKNKSELKKVYRKEAKIRHPDINNSNGSDFIELMNSYDYINNLLKD